MTEAGHLLQRGQARSLYLAQQQNQQHQQMAARTRTIPQAQGLPKAEIQYLRGASVPKPPMNEYSRVPDASKDCVSGAPEAEND